MGNLVERNQGMTRSKFNDYSIPLNYNSSNPVVGATCIYNIMSNNENANPEDYYNQEHYMTYKNIVDKDCLDRDRLQRVLASCENRNLSDAVMLQQVVKGRIGINDTNYNFRENGLAQQYGNLLNNLFSRGEGFGFVTNDNREYNTFQSALVNLYGSNLEAAGINLYEAKDGNKYIYFTKDNADRAVDFCRIGQNIINTPNKRRSTRHGFNTIHINGENISADNKQIAKNPDAMYDDYRLNIYPDMERYLTMELYNADAIINFGNKLERKVNRFEKKMSKDESLDSVVQTINYPSFTPQDSKLYQLMQTPEGATLLDKSTMKFTEAKSYMDNKTKSIIGEIKSNFNYVDVRKLNDDGRWSKTLDYNDRNNKYKDLFLDNNSNIEYLGSTYIPSEGKLYQRVRIGYTRTVNKNKVKGESGEYLVHISNPEIEQFENDKNVINTKEVEQLDGDKYASLNIMFGITDYNKNKEKDTELPNYMVWQLKAQRDENDIPTGNYVIGVSNSYLTDGVTPFGGNLDGFREKLNETGNGVVIDRETAIKFRGLYNDIQQIRNNELMIDNGKSQMTEEQYNNLVSINQNNFNAVCKSYIDLLNSTIYINNPIDIENKNDERLINIITRCKDMVGLYNGGMDYYNDMKNRFDVTNKFNRNAY